MAFENWWRSKYPISTTKEVFDLMRDAYAAGATEEREAIISLAAEQGWAMKNEDPFEDAVRDICVMRSNVQGEGAPERSGGNPQAPLAGAPSRPAG